MSAWEGWSAVAQVSSQHSLDFTILTFFAPRYSERKKEAHWFQGDKHGNSYIGASHALFSPYRASCAHRHVRAQSRSQLQELQTITFQDSQLARTSSGRIINREQRKPSHGRSRAGRTHASNDLQRQRQLSRQTRHQRNDAEGGNTKRSTAQGDYNKSVVTVMNDACTKVLTLIFVVNHDLPQIVYTLWICSQLP